MSRKKLKKQKKVFRWRKISTAPTTGRQGIWLKVPGREPQFAYSNTWWRSGSSAGNAPTHWCPDGEETKALHESLERRERLALRRPVGPLQRLEAYQRRPWNQKREDGDAAMNARLLEDFLQGCSVKALSRHFKRTETWIEERLRQQMRMRRKPCGVPLGW